MVRGLFKVLIKALTKASGKVIWVTVMLVILFQMNTTFAEVLTEELMEKTERPVLVIGDDINYPPYSYLDDEGDPTGFSIEIMREVADVMGYDVEFRLNHWNEVRSSLENEEIDAISGMFRSPAREEIYTFSTLHSVATGDVFSHKGGSIEDVSELRDQVVVVQKSDIIHEYLKSQDLNIHFIEVSTVDEALELVADGVYPYAALLKPTAHYIIDKNNLKGIQASGLKLAPNDFCFAVNKSDEHLVHVLNAGLNIIKSTGVYQPIYDKWLGVYEERTLMDVIEAYRWLLIGLGLGVALLVAWMIMLNHMVKVKTCELHETNKKLVKSEEDLTAANEELIAMNEELESNFEELTAIEEELRSHYERLLESEKELQKSEERSRAIVNAIPDLLFIFDREGTILECQTSGNECLTMPKEMFVGKSICDIMPHENASIGQQMLKKALEMNEVQSFEYQVRISDQWHYFEMRLSKSQENEVIGITRNITEDYEHKKRIEYLSYHDQLTGLFNRRFFEEELTRLDSEENLPFTLVMADVNGLKLINDSFGHYMGDRLLKKMAEVLKRSCVEGQMISRIGGDEFVILLPGMGDADAEALINRIREISAHEKVAAMDLSISYGWATKKDSDENILEVLNRAEDYMYKRKLFEGPSMRGKTIGAIIHTLHEKNQREEEHSKRVSNHCRNLANALGFSEKDADEMGSAGLLHDIGKIAIAEYLLNKPGKLTEDEVEEVHRHPEIGYRILSSVNDMSEMADYVLSHHERWDGNGYPRGLKGEEIPVQARIIAIADSYDAMTSERSYKKSISKDEAISELVKNAGSQFDPVMTHVFIDAVLGPSNELKIEADEFTV